MDLKNLKTKVLVFALLILIIPFQVYAYSDYIIAGGENVGIKINSNYVMVVGSYDIGTDQNKTLVPGDKILRINGYKVSSINEMLNVISKTIKNSSVSVDYLRGAEENTTTLKLVLDENGVYKTGLYVRDSISSLFTVELRAISKLVSTYLGRPSSKVASNTFKTHTAAHTPIEVLRYNCCL